MTITRSFSATPNVISEKLPYILLGHYPEQHGSRCVGLTPICDVSDIKRISSHKSTFKYNYSRQNSAQTHHLSITQPSASAADFLPSKHLPQSSKPATDLDNLVSGTSHPFCQTFHKLNWLTKSARYIFCRCYFSIRVMISLSAVLLLMLFSAFHAASQVAYV